MGVGPFRGVVGAPLRPPSWWRTCARVPLELYHPVPTGAVESATVVTDRETGRSRGFGFVEMATADEAEAAVKKFNGQEVDGRTLKVELAKPSGSGGARSGGGGYRSGGRGGSRW